MTPRHTMPPKELTRSPRLAWESSDKGEAGARMGPYERPPHHPNPFDDSDGGAIVENVLVFLGVRSLVAFGATSVSHRIAMKREIEYRKVRIADAEIEVARLMSAQHQSSTLSSYIRIRLHHFMDTSNCGGIHLDPEDWPRRYERWGSALTEEKFYEIKELYSCVMEENGGRQVCLNNLHYGDFIAAKKLVYDVMRLIDDEIGVFYAIKKGFHVSKDDGGSTIIDYFDVQEDEPVDDNDYYYHEGDYEEEEEEVEERDKLLRFGDDAPGDRIHIFHEERQKFFSTMSDGGPGSLFILPKCFYFPDIADNARSVPIECIKTVIRLANDFGVALTFLVEGRIPPGRFKEILPDRILRVVGDVDDVDAFRVVMREVFFLRQGGFYQQGIKPHLIKILEFADGMFKDDSGEVYESFVVLLCLFSLPNVDANSR
jgi:hypothetical protein